MSFKQPYHQNYLINRGHTNLLLGNRSALRLHDVVLLLFADPPVVSRTVRGHQPEYDEEHPHLDADDVETPVPTEGLRDGADEGPRGTGAEGVAHEGAHELALFLRRRPSCDEALQGRVYRTLKE